MTLSYTYEARRIGKGDQPRMRAFFPPSLIIPKIDIFEDFGDGDQVYEKMAVSMKDWFRA